MVNIFITITLIFYRCIQSVIYNININTLPLSNKLLPRNFKRIQPTSQMRLILDPIPFFFLIAIPKFQFDHSRNNRPSAFFQILFPLQLFQNRNSLIPFKLINFQYIKNLAFKIIRSQNIVNSNNRKGDNIHPPNAHKKRYNPPRRSPRKVIPIPHSSHSQNNHPHAIFNIPHIISGICYITARFIIIRSSERAYLLMKSLMKECK